MSDELMTSHQVAKSAGASVSYVQILRRCGVLVAASAEHRTTGGGGNSIIYLFSPDAVEIVRAEKASARERQRGSCRTGSPVDGVRRVCHKRPLPDGSGRPCATFDLDCQVCLDYYRVVPGISGSGTGDAGMATA